MTSPKKSRDEGAGRNPTNVPSQEDEEDIVDEVDAERDEETGTLMADVDKVRELGALDPQSARANRHVNRVVDKKRKGEKVSFGIEDAVPLYDAVLRVWTYDKVEIRAQNLVTREQHYIKSQPRSGFDLYEHLRVIHGARDAAEYKVEFVGAQRKEYIATGRIVMPDARVPGQSPGQPPQPYYPQQGYPPPQAPPPAPQAPTFVMPQPGADPMQAAQQILNLADQIRERMTPPQPAPQAPVPPPPQTSDPTVLLNWAIQAAQRLQPQAAQQPQPQPQQPTAPTGMPQFAPPPGTAWMYYVPPGASTGGWVAQPLGGNVGVGGGDSGPMHRSPFQRPQYFPQSNPNDERPRGYQGPPQRERTPAQVFREQIASARDLFNTAQELGAMFGGGGGSSSEVNEPSDDDEDDSPVKVMKAGDIEYVADKSDGHIRWAETGLILFPRVLKWAGEQHEKIQAAKREQQQPQRRREALPPGYVRVDENFVPPKGFVAVPVAQDDLPEPPSEMPPTVDEEEQEAPPQRPTWGAPTVIPQNG